MTTPRISASSYSNTAPLVWSFLYGREHGRVEIILDNAPARSAELLAQDRVDAALVPVIAYQMIDDVKLVPDVCVGAREKVRSVCLVTKGEDLEQVKSVALDVSSRTSVALTKIIFREFLGFEPQWRDASPDIDAMLATSDAALIIGDPALTLSSPPYQGGVAGGRGGSFSKELRTFDLAHLWRTHTGLGFIFAMWMTRRENIDIDFAAARDEGLAHIDDIAANYESQIGLTRDQMRTYLTDNISFSPDDSMKKGMELYFRLAQKNGLLTENKPLVFV
ncbi:MAG: menaquinone biosynthesis protein [Acidobacteria bacterium]|nr:menaquinone biosynthesis protein [Acidobacteriota bacterium]